MICLVSRTKYKHFKLNLRATALLNKRLSCDNAAVLDRNLHSFPKHLSCKEMCSIVIYTRSQSTWVARKLVGIIIICVISIGDFVTKFLNNIEARTTWKIKSTRETLFFSPYLKGKINRKWSQILFTLSFPMYPTERCADLCKFMRLTTFF